MRIRSFLFSLASLFTLLCFEGFSQTIGNQKVIQVPTTAWKTPANALLSLPDDYNSGSKEYPLILFLHGWGEAGSDITKLLGTALPQRIAQGFKPAAINPKDGKLYKFIVVSPQAPDFSFQYGHIKIILADILKRYRVDETRIYITGLSAGGYGTWTCVSDDAEFAKKIAAIAPISSMAVDGNRPNTINNAGKTGVGVWNICGMADDKWTIAVDYTNRVNAVNPVSKAKLTGLPGVGHSAWNQGYDPNWKVDNMNLYEWLLQFSRGNSKQEEKQEKQEEKQAEKEPARPKKVGYIDAGSDVTITLPVNSATVYGKGGADDGYELVRSKWTKISGPSQFTLSGEYASSATLSNLVAGVYTIELAAIDNKGTIFRDNVTITVNPAPSKRAPKVNAGKDVTLTWPTNTTVLEADGTTALDGAKLVKGKWYKISGPGQFKLINDETAYPILTNLVEGVYIIELAVLDDNGLIGRDEVKITVLPSPHGRILGGANSGVQSTAETVALTETGSLQLYPNPVADVVRIKFTSPATGEVKVKIFDIVGKQVQTAEMEKQGMVFDKVMNISTLPRGQYIMRFEFSNGSSITNKFIKL